MLKLTVSGGLSLLQQCRRCFWLEYKWGIKRPVGIFPSLPSSMDLLIKQHFDQYGETLPPELIGKVEGTLADRRLVQRWRNWRTGLHYVNSQLGVRITGALDDCLYSPVAGQYSPLDFKTKGSLPSPGYSAKYYQLQMDVYALLLQESGYPIGQKAVVVYFVPIRVLDDERWQFATMIDTVEVDPQRVIVLMTQAVAILQSSQPPEKNGNCEWCNYVIREEARL